MLYTILYFSINCTPSFPWNYTCKNAEVGPRIPIGGLSGSLLGGKQICLILTHWLPDGPFPPRHASYALSAWLHGRRCWGDRIGLVGNEGTSNSLQISRNYPLLQNSLVISETGLVRPASFPTDWANAYQAALIIQSHYKAYTDIYLTGIFFENPGLK